MGCGAETEANSLMTSLTTGEDFTPPVVNLDDPSFVIPPAGAFADPVTKLTNDDLTTGSITGSGTFDVLMRGFTAHLQDQFDKRRITGEQFAKAYVELTQGAMNNAVQFLLGRDQSYWQAVLAQQQAIAAQAEAITARVNLETAKVNLLAQRYAMYGHKANYALAKMKLSTESVGYCIAQFNLDQMLPAQLVVTREQGEAQRAQTSDTRSDGITPVAGSVGKQKDLYSQQITSYQRDSEIKAAKPFIDAWIAQKTVDDGLLAPDGFTNASLDVILSKIKELNGFVAVEV